MPDDTATPAPVTGATPRQRVHVDAEHDGAIRDGDMLMAVAKGSAVGIPVVFAILFLIDLFAGLDVPMAALGASIPAVIFGAFIGTAFFIGRASDAAAARAHS